MYAIYPNINDLNNFIKVELDINYVYQRKMERDNLQDMPLSIEAEEIAEMLREQVPLGVPYLLIKPSEYPTDRDFRDAWEADFTNPDGYGTKKI